MRGILSLILLVANTCYATLYINEIQSGNTKIPDDVGNYTTDWVEIYNSDSSSVNLQGYYLSDDDTKPTKWTFPNVSIPANGFLMVWASNIKPAPTQMHASFAISASGEPILLSDPQGALIDRFPPVAIATDVSMGRKPNGTGALYFFNQPTPKASNTTAGTSIDKLPGPGFSVPGGMFTNNVTVSMSTTVTGGTIRYTTDGSDPTESSPVYSNALTLTNPSNNPNVISEIPTNYLDTGAPYYEGWQQPSGKVFKINVVRARVFKAGSDPGEITTQSYLIDPAGASRYPYPVVSIATTKENLFSNETGIYVPGNYNNYSQEGKEWERPGHIEFFETGGVPAFKGTIGIRINGNTTANRPRKALRIYNRSTDGSNTFDYKIFPEKDVSSFETFLLRASGNDWGQSIFRDAFVSTLSIHTGLDRMASRPVVVFINGEYWGIHNIRDRTDEGYYLHHYGLKDTEFTQLESAAANGRSWPVYDRGEPSLLADFEDILNKAYAGDFATAQGYASLTQRIDIDNFIDYQIYEIWSGNTDWPGNNVRLWRAVTPDTNPDANPRFDGRWRWLLYDTDLGLGLNFTYVPGVNEGPYHDTLSYASTIGATGFIGNSEEGTRMLRKTLENSVFRTKFINRFADLLNSALSSTNVSAKLNTFQSLYAQGMAEHTDRWRQPFDWSGDVTRIRNYINARPDAVRGHIQNRFNLAGTAQLTVNVDNTNRGTIKVNTLDLAPGTEGVPASPYPWTGAYFQGVPVTLTAQPKPGYKFVSWSNSTSTGPTVAASDSAANYGSWNSGSSGGTGFGPWSLNVSNGDSPNDNAGWFLDNGRGGWGLYANGGQTVWVYRSLSNALQVGQTFTARVQPGWVDYFGDVGFELANSSGGILLKVSHPGWSSNYVINDNWTDIPASTGPVDIEINLVASNSYSARITTVGGATYTNTGTLFALDDRTVRRFLAYNYTAGSGDGANFYVTSMKVTTPAGPGGGTYTNYSTSATITPTLSAASTFLAGFEVAGAMSLAIESPTFWALGTSLPGVRVIARTIIGDPDPTFAGTVTLNITGPNGFSQQLSMQAANGIATFSGIMLPAAGNYSMSAASGALSTQQSSALAINDTATFLPSGNGTWNLTNSWDIGVVPNSATARVLIPTITADRNVNLTSNITSAAIVFDNGTMIFRNRIRNNDTNSSLTLQAGTAPASITVNGTGTGYANLEFTNAGNLVLGGDVVLNVQNAAAGNSEYGALRIQGNVSGPGGIIKRGPGLAGITGTGKTFSGNVVIEQGVLTFSEPAITGNNVTNYTVQPGGQLRLSSAYVTPGVPRTNSFKGPLNLAGSGRSGVPDNENLGVLGALRLETGSTGTTAALTNVVNITGTTDIHVSASNAISLQGPLQGTSVLTKSGGGTLALGSSASTFAGAITVNRGTLALNVANLTNTTNTLALVAGTTLTGAGRWNGMLQAQDSSTLSFNLGNAPAMQAPIRAGQVIASGIVTIAIQPDAGSVEGTYPLLAFDGSFIGTNNLALNVNSAVFPASRLVFTNDTLAVTLRTIALTEREQWLEQYGLPVDGTGDGADNADPDNDRIPNIIERAFFLNPVRSDAALPVTVAQSDGNVMVVTYHVAKNQSDLAVVPEIATGLLPGNAWTPATAAVVDDTNPDYTTCRIELPAAPGAGFVRFTVKRN